GRGAGGPAAPARGGRAAGGRRVPGGGRPGRGLPRSDRGDGAVRLRDRVNPVLEQELRQRLRGRAAWVSLTAYLVVLGLILRLVFDVATRTDTVFGASQAQAASSAGRSIYHWLLFVMLGLICFIVPGLTAGA